MEKDCCMATLVSDSLFLYKYSKYFKYLNRYKPHSYTKVEIGNLVLFLFLHYFGYRTKIYLEVGHVLNSCKGYTVKLPIINPSPHPHAYKLPRFYAHQFTTIQL